MKYWFFIILLALTRTSTGSEASFYALSSLYFYLDNLSSGTEEIAFSDEDVAQLWEVAAEDPSSELDLAYQEYYQEHSVLSAKDRVEALWKKCNPYPPSYPNFDENPRFDKKMKNRMRPYLLPLKHPLRSSLDAIFARSRVVANDTTLAQAGFNILYSQPYTHIRVASHPDLPGHLVKAHLDCDTQTRDGIPSWVWLTDRCIGAKLIRDLIKNKKIRHFSVPDKWLYTISSSAPEHIQLVILLVEDMQLVSRDETLEAWKTIITHHHLDELYCILSHGLSSGFIAGNIPYTRSGKFACIDTEFYDRKIKYSRVNKYLSDEMSQYWDELVRTGGRPRK